MSVGAVATVATFQLPELTQRLFAPPAGVALIGLGYSLWRDQRTTRPVPSGYQLRVDGHLDQHWASELGGHGHRVDRFPRPYRSIIVPKICS